MRGFEQYLAGEAAVAAFAEGRGGPLAAPLAGAPVAAFRPAARFPATYSRKFVAGLERGFGKDTTLTVDYSLIRGFHLPRLRNARLGLPPRYELEQSARSAFHGGSVTLNRRMSRELSFLLTYSGGTTHDDGSDYDEQPMDPAGTRKDWALSRQHQAHRMVASALFDLPVELWPGGPRWLLGPLDRVTVAPIVTAGTGRPVNALDSTDTFRTGAYPISARPYGLARNPYLSPGTFSTELRLMKTIPMKKERARMQFGVEFFNLTNHSNPLRVSPYYTARGAKLDTYRDFLETNNARQIGFFAQFEY